MEKTLQIKDNGIGEYPIEQVLSLTSLPMSPCSYGREFKDNKPSVVSPQTLYDGTFVQAIVPLEDEFKNRPIVAQIQTQQDIPEHATLKCEIEIEIYGKGFKLMKQFGYKGNGPLLVNSKGLRKPTKATCKCKGDTTSLGFKIIPLHLGVNKFVPKPNHLPQLECSCMIETLVERSNEDNFLDPIPLDIAMLFSKPDESIAYNDMIEIDSDFD